MTRALAQRICARRKSERLAKQFQSAEGAPAHAEAPAVSSSALIPKETVGATHSHPFESFGIPDFLLRKQ